MSILRLLNCLPNRINYEGYIFTLLVEGDYVGYFLTHCVSKKKYKRDAFKSGFWYEKNRIVVSSVGSNYLFKIFLYDDANETYYQALQELINIFQKNGISLNATTMQIEDAEYKEVNTKLL